MRLILSIIFGLAVMFKVGTASALPMISVDLDPGTAGIQSALTVDPGDTFTVDVVYTGDGAATFDAFAFDVVFNDMGAGVLGLVGGTGSPTAGSIAATAPIAALDAFGGVFVGIGIGDALTPSGVPFPIAAPFTAGSDGLGMFSIALPFGGGVPIGAGVDVDLFTLGLVALAPGMSSVAPSLGVKPIPPPLGGLFIAGAPVGHTLASGSVTVTAPIPAPTTIALLGIGLAGLVGYGSRRRLKGRSALLHKKSNT